MGTEKNMYDVDELIDACKLTAKHLPLEPIPYDVDHPLVGHAMISIATALKQVRNNRIKLQRRCQKIKISKGLQILVYFRSWFEVGCSHTSVIA